MRNEDFEKRHNYDSSIPYADEVQRYREAMRTGDKERAGEVLRKHGGILSLYGKALYQREQQNITGKKK